MYIHGHIYVTHIVTQLILYSKKSFYQFDKYQINTNHFIQLSNICIIIYIICLIYIIYLIFIYLIFIKHLLYEK